MTLLTPHIHILYVITANDTVTVCVYYVIYIHTYLSFSQSPAPGPAGVVPQEGMPFVYMHTCGEQLYTCSVPCSNNDVLD